MMRYVAGSRLGQHDILAMSFREPQRTDENISYKSQADLRATLKQRLSSTNMPSEVLDVFNRCTSFIETAVYDYPPISSWSQWDCFRLMGDSGT